MLNFRELTLSDRQRIHPDFFRLENHGSEFSFANLFFWGDQKIAFCGDAPVFLSRFGTHYSYPLPLCTDWCELLPVLRADAHERGIPFLLFGLNVQEVERLHAHFPDAFSVRPVRDSFDYVYEIDRLAELHGKKLQAKRNHCNRFEAAHPNYRVLPLTPEWIEPCRTFTEHWYEAHAAYGAQKDYEGERRAISRAFDHFDALGMEGIVLETEDGMVGFSMGNRIRRDTFDVNFEKALAEVNGAYPMVNREFARLLRQRYPEVRFLNREDDMGIAGLRTAKESYFPDILLEKFVAEERI